MGRRVLDFDARAGSIVLYFSYLLDSSLLTIRVLKVCQAYFLADEVSLNF